MARRISKRKQPEIEVKQLKAVEKISGKVLDEKTISVLVDFINNKVIKSLDYPISTGKEAVVFKATSPSGGKLAVIIFNFETSRFHNMLDYIQGDKRFDHQIHNKRELVNVWARKEFANLKKCFAAGVRVPKPIKYKQNVIVMEFVGENNVATPILAKVRLSDPQGVYEKILGSMKKMFEAKLVHADLSEFNILVLLENNVEQPVFIDLAQAVVLDHPKAKEFLEKDCFNIAKYFSKRGVQTDGKTVYTFVTA
ncbi:serine protein kinase RIO [Candidatus Micrarchaeota archaeon]|nr:serine protein kinase RIO [Candidatus Micrarchaeota archaeon]